MAIKKMTIGIDNNGRVVDDLELATVIYETEYKKEDSEAELVSEKIYLAKGAKIPSSVVSEVESEV